MPRPASAGRPSGCGSTRRPTPPNLNMARCLCRDGDARRRDLERGQGHDPPARTVRRARHRRARGDRAKCANSRRSGWPAARLREIWFEPTFHKHRRRTVQRGHIHAEGAAYDHQAFRPWRLQALAFKAIRTLFPDYELWRDFPYEYAFGKLADRRHQRRPGLARMGRRCRRDPGRPRCACRPRRSRVDRSARASPALLICLRSAGLSATPPLC